MFNVAPPRTDSGADVLAPLPARLIRGAGDCHPTEVHQLEPTLFHHANFVRCLERFKNDLYLFAAHGWLRTNEKQDQSPPGRAQHPALHHHLSTLNFLITTGSSICLDCVVIWEQAACHQIMVQCFLPSLHRFLIVIGGERGYELVASGTHAGMAVTNVRKTSIAIFGKLNLQPTRRYPG